MEIQQIKKSMQDIAKTLSSLVEEKLGEHSALEEQFRSLTRQVERVVGEALGSRPQDKVVLRFKKLEHFRGDLPAYETAGASGMDVRARLEQPYVLKPGQRTLIPTGLSMEIPYGYEIQVRPRSGLAIKRGLGLVNSPGTIDADYRGELKIIVINLGQEPIEIQDQERIAQLVLCPVIQPRIEEVTALGDTDRGSGGFGSTGV